MKQVLQHLKTGEMEVAEVPCPQAAPGGLLIRTRVSLISAGTERMLVEFSKGNLIQKARQQPEKVQQVLDKVRTDGLVPTLEAVQRKLDEPMPLGYCNVGEVIAVGAGVDGFVPGDRVVSNGNHAEVVSVPRNLCARIPEGVADDEAAFTVLGAIALQGIRLAAPTLGERVLVFGAGLLGLLTVQLLRANGCEVMAVDLNADRLRLAREFGAETVNVAEGADPVRAAMTWTNGIGADAVLITASAKTDEIMHQAAEASRQRGRIVLVGVVGLNLRRSDFFKKELTFQVSCSYGPGRYDEAYEQAGQDYPVGYVRWTEQRNFEAILGAMKAGSVRASGLVTHRFALNDAVGAYDKIQNDGTALGVLLDYPEAEAVETAATVRLRQRSKPAGDALRVGVIGVGNFAKAVILPAIAKAGADLAWVAARSSTVGTLHAARKFGAEKATMDFREVLADEAVKAVFILTGHHQHAGQVAEALRAGKHVFVEKPLAISPEQLDVVREAVAERGELQLLVGFNRRFSPHIVKMRELLKGRSEPATLSMTVNAGDIPANTWIQDLAKGGGRIIGEGCHFIDLLMHLVGSPIVRVYAQRVGEGPAVRDDKMTIVLTFADGSIGTVHYFANGSKSFPKEMLEVFSDGRVLRMENFRRTLGYGMKSFKEFKTLRQDKGHDKEVAAFLARVAKGGAPVIPFAELENVTLASIAAMESARTHAAVEL